MAHTVLNVVAELGEGLGVTFGHKDGVVAEAVGASLLGDDVAMDDALEVVLLSLVDEGDVGAETGWPTLLLQVAGEWFGGKGGKLLKKVVHVVFVASCGGCESVDGGIAGREYAWLPIEGFDLQARVVGKAIKPIVLLHVMGFLQGVLAEGGTCFGDVHVASDVVEALDFELMAKDGTYLLKLVSVASGKNECIHCGLVFTIVRLYGCLMCEISTFISQMVAFFHLFLVFFCFFRIFV